MYADILNGLIFDAVYGSWILSLLLFTLADNNSTRYYEITDVLLANIEILADCYIVFSKLYIVTVILEYS